MPTNRAHQQQQVASPAATTHKPHERQFRRVSGQTGTFSRQQYIKTDQPPNFPKPANAVVILDDCNIKQEKMCIENPVHRQTVHNRTIPRVLLLELPLPRTPHPRPYHSRHHQTNHSEKDADGILDSIPHRRLLLWGTVKTKTTEKKHRRKKKRVGIMEHVISCSELLRVGHTLRPKPT